MRTLIKVELSDGTVCRMAPKAFSLFFSMGRVTRFERPEEWSGAEAIFPVGIEAENGIW